MRRLTAAEWELINDALALYEASVVDFDLSEREQGRLEARIATLRGKVSERIKV